MWEDKINKEEIILELEKKVREFLKDPEIFAIFINKLLQLSEAEAKKMAFNTSFEIPGEVDIIKEYKNAEKIELPRCDYNKFSIGDVLFKRRSIREYENTPLSIHELTCILNYSYGIRETAPAYNLPNFPFRTAPSGGGLQGIELYCLVNNIDGIDEGLYYFNPVENALNVIFKGFCRGMLLELCRGQEFVAEAPVIFFLTGVLKKGLWKYSNTYYRILLIDSGCVAENIHLVATSLNLGSCIIAGFDAEKVAKFLQLEDPFEIPILIVSVGKIKRGM